MIVFTPSRLALPLCKYSKILAWSITPVNLQKAVAQGFLVYPKYPYCMLASMREALPVEEEKGAIRVHQKALWKGLAP